MMSVLPEDLLEEILFRVPATSLIRLRSTCKRWDRLLNERRFTRKHFDKAAKQPLNIMSNDFESHWTSINLHISSRIEVTGKLNLIDPHSNLDQIKIWRFFHCDGLWLCVTYENNPRLVVWNPCTGQTRWINRYKQGATYALGSYQDKNSNDNSYKILSCMSYGPYRDKPEFEIYEINSNSWRILDITVDFSLVCHNRGVSLKGKTYLIARDEKGCGKILLVSFDYTTEIFERLRLPRQFTSYTTLILSVVREEKISVLSQCDFTSKTEVWVTNKISETKAVSWSKVLALYLEPGFQSWHGGSFLFDEEKKVLVCCDWLLYEGKTKVYIVGEDNEVIKVNFEVRSYLPSLFNYVPSLIQI